VTIKPIIDARTGKPLNIRDLDGSDELVRLRSHEENRRHWRRALCPAGRGPWPVALEAISIKADHRAEAFDWRGGYYDVTDVVNPRDQARASHHQRQALARLPA